jgi:hypothetical protein
MEWIHAGVYIYIDPDGVTIVKQMTDEQPYSWRAMNWRRTSLYRDVWDVFVVYAGIQGYTIDENTNMFIGHENDQIVLSIEEHGITAISMNCGYHCDGPLYSNEERGRVYILD